MKFEVFIAIFAAAASVSASAPTTCKAPSPQCKYIPQQDAKQCHDLIEAKKIHLSTCKAPESTVTTTRSVGPTTTVTKTISPPEVTKKVYKTVTKHGQPDHPPTITVTTTSTSIRKSTVTDTATSLHTLTITTTDIKTESTSTTVTSTSTTVMPWEETDYCQLPKKRDDMPRELEGRDTNKRDSRRAPLPKDCSCFLTTTQPGATKTATFVTKGTPCTQTIYEHGYQTSTITRIVTVTKYDSYNIVYAPETTKTVVKTITQTHHTTTTVVKQKTSTLTKTGTTVIASTATSTATATTTAEPCDDPSVNYTRDGIKISSGPTVGSAYNGVSLKGCCEECFGSPSCVFFTYNIQTNSACTVYRIDPDATGLYCPGTSTKCPRGFAYTRWTDKDPDTVDPLSYYLGTCTVFDRQQ